MKKKRLKKLMLSSDTIRVLETFDQVRGGEPIGSLEVCVETEPACAPQPSWIANTCVNKRCGTTIA